VMVSEVMAYVGIAWRRFDHWWQDPAMHLCPECNRHCDCADGEAEIEGCVHFMTPACPACVGEAEDDADPP